MMRATCVEPRAKPVMSSVPVMDAPTASASTPRSLLPWPLSGGREGEGRVSMDGGKGGEGGGGGGGEGGEGGGEGSGGTSGGCVPEADMKSR